MNKFFKQFVALSLTPLALLSLNKPAQAQCTTTISVESIDETYFTYSDLLSSIVLNPILLPVHPALAQGVGLAEAIQSGCANIDFWSFRVSDGSFDFQFDTGVPRIGMAGFDFGRDGVVLNGSPQNFFTQNLDIGPCRPMPITRLIYMGGGVNVFAAHVGTAPYPRKIRKATYHTCRDIVVENNSNSPIELPVSISGSVIAAEAFGWTERTFAKAKLRVHGTIAGQGFDEKAEVESSGPVFPEEGNINVTRRIMVAPNTGRHTIRIDISGEAETDVQAKSAGLFGSLTDSVTAAVEFPNSIVIGNFTGSNGSPLPVGVRIYDAADGSLYADTRVFPGTPNLQTTVSLRRDTSTNEVIADVSVKNIGVGEALGVRVTEAALNNRPSSTSLPQSIGRLIPELPAGLAVRTFRFPAAVGTRGTRTTLRINGTRNGGSFGGTFRVTLP